MCVQSPVFCIVIEYCPYGTLFNLLRDGKEVAPKKLVEWTKQIATRMNQPNKWILIFDLFQHFD